jgi:hypothetical protein
VEHYAEEDRSHGHRVCHIVGSLDDRPYPASGMSRMTQRYMHLSPAVLDSAIRLLDPVRTVATSVAASAAGTRKVGNV